MKSKVEGRDGQRLTTGLLVTGLLDKGDDPGN